MPHFAKRPRLTFEPNFQTQSQMQGLMVAGAPVDEEEEKKKKELEEKEEEEEKGCLRVSRHIRTAGDTHTEGHRVPEPYLGRLQR